MSLESRVTRLEKGAQIDVPANARLYDGDGVQVDARVTRMPTKQSYGEAMLPTGKAVPIAPTMTLEDVIRRARDREKKETGESHTRKELPAGILFLRVDGKEGFCEIINRAQRRRTANS